MATYKDQALGHQTVVLDGNEYLGCQFESCQLIYKGGELPRLNQCEFVHALGTWKTPPNERSASFAASIYHSGPGGRELVEDTLKHVRIRA